MCSRFSRSITKLKFWKTSKFLPLHFVPHSSSIKLFLFHKFWKKYFYTMWGRHLLLKRFEKFFSFTTHGSTDFKDVSSRKKIISESFWLRKGYLTFSLATTSQLFRNIFKLDLTCIFSSVRADWNTNFRVRTPCTVGFH